MFGEDKEKGLRGAMLATGSALNEIAQNSSAAAGEVVDFLSKVGGVGNMAKFTQAQLMGLGSALSQNQQEMATSSTVISQLVTKMFQDTARYATVAGQDVEEFTELLNTDANAALMKFLSAMQERGGFADMAPMFQEMNLNGTRAVGVLSTLAAHLDEVTEAQQLATEAYEEGTSVIDEFNTMNETVQAQIEKAQKHFHELSVELGEKLLPVGKYAISAGSVMVKLLSSLVTFVNNYKAVLVGLGVALVALNAKQLVHIATTKTQIFVNETLITTFKKLKVAIMSNPWGVAIAAVTMLATAIYDLVSNMNEAKKSITALQQANKEATAEYSKQEGKIKTLSERVHDNTIALSERKKALKELKEIVPDYLADLTSEGELINDNTKALDAYCESLLQTMKLKKYQEKLEEKAGEVADKELERREKEKELQEAHDKTEETKNKQGANAESSVFSYTGGNLSYNKEVTDAENREKALSNEIKTLNEEIDKGKQEYQELYDSYKSLQPKESEGEKPKPDKPEPKTETGGGSTKDELKERENEVKQANERMQIENILAYRSGEKTYSEYQDTLNTLTQQGYDERKKIYEDANATERAEYTKLLKEESDWQESQRTDDVKRSKEYYQREKNERDAYLKAAFYDQTSEIYQNEDALNEALFQCDMEYQRKLLSLMKEGTQEWENQVYDIEQKEKNRQTQLQIDYYNKVQDLREDYNLASAKEMEKAELDALEALYRSKMNKGLLSEEEYQKARLAIVKKYAGQEADESTKGQASSALETAKQKVGEKKQSSGNDLVSSMAGIFKEVEYRKQVNEELEKLYQANAISYETYQEAIKQNSKETWNDVLSAATLALSSISSLLGAASSYAQACSDLETNKITADYDKQIEAAGNNSKKKEKLEKERDEKIKEAKTKANKRAMEIEIAQAMASTAAAAINAYASASKESWHLGPIAAAAAVAAGMLQIATIKKQHEAEEAGYYEGGFTGGTQFRKKAGIVHEGEFVANHEAVANANILPALQLIDRAQRNNTVGSLTSEDVSRTLGQNNTTVVSAPTVNVMTDNEELNGALTQLNQSMQQLNLVLGGNIRAVVSIDGDDGVAKNLERYNRMKNRV
ncbi:MAG: phage tail tape measure protein [Clostridia bacterium]|nr:phage tail tape measure protein [Clostridia bacterium]